MFELPIFDDFMPSAGVCSKFSRASVNAKVKMNVPLMGWRVMSVPTLSNDHTLPDL